MESLCHFDAAGVLSPHDVTVFREIIYGHFQRHGRDFPWRRTGDPYEILVSEIMLQQTQVDRVMRWYGRFLTAFPDLATLAQASVHEILSVWQGLGYNRRGLFLQRLACQVVEEFGGRLPDSPEVLRTLPGIGPATAGALATFAFNRPVVFLETNIRRVFLHFFFPHSTGVTDRQLFPLVGQTLDTTRPRLWFYALMDYGALLKKRVGGLNDRSSLYVKQPPFEGSDRQLRGRILELLLEGHALTERDIRTRVSENTVRVSRIVADLIREGFIAQRGNRFRISD